MSQRISDFDLITRLSGVVMGDAHSFLLQNIFEHGILGLLFVLFFSFLALKISFRHQQIYGGPLMILTMFMVLYSFTTAFKHAVMLIPFMLIILKDDKIDELKKVNRYLITRMFSYRFCSFNLITIR